MKLSKLEFSTFETKPNEWRITDCTFGEINLVVGHNATGKTRTLNVVQSLAMLLSEANELPFMDGTFSVLFENGAETISYTLEYRERQVTQEQLNIDDQTLLEREANGKGHIYVEQLKQEIDFQSAPNRIAVSAKRDALQHPFLEPLYEWGQGVLRFDFGTSLGRNNLRPAQLPEEEIQINPKETQQSVIDKFLKGEQLSLASFANQVMEDMAQIGYQLESISAEAPPNFPSTSDPRINNVLVTLLGLSVKEKDRRDNTFQLFMSQGMFRALSLIIQLNYLLLDTSKPSCILIDDIGEGLDFERSSSLLQLIIEKVKGSGIQLIMATNDRFIMNGVPLEYWIIVERRGSELLYHNYRNARQMFDDFELTGLSNFDLFSSNYYLRDGA